MKIIRNATKIKKFSSDNNPIRTDYHVRRHRKTLVLKIVT